MKELLNILRQEVELHEQLISMLQKESEGFGRLRGSELLKLQGDRPPDSGEHQARRQDLVAESQQSSH